MITPVFKQSPLDPHEAQRQASDPLCSIWVNASAGSGKTSVLTKRVTRLLLSGVRPEKILCLTYTRAGAAEMTNRVTAMLSKWAVCSDSDLDADLFSLQKGEPDNRQRTQARRLFAQVLSCPGGLRIRTLHAFCQEILSRFPIEAGLPPHFALIDEQEMDILQREAQDDVLRQANENPHGAVAYALAALVGGGEHGFDPMLREIMQSRSRLAVDIAQTLASTRDLLRIDVDVKPDNIRRAIMENLPEEALRKLALYLSASTPSIQQRGHILSSVLATPNPARHARFEDYCRVFLTQDYQPRKKFCDQKTLAKYPDIQPLCEGMTTRLLLALERIEAAEIAALTAAVLTVGKVYAEQVAARKKSRAALDYDDLISFTAALLSTSRIAPWILYKLDKNLDHILVDEAQDTSRAQWHIIQALTAEFFSGSGARDSVNRTLFVVGDEKQSIFSFQNADPKSFIAEREKYAQALSNAGKTFKKIGLHTSFRSAPAILGAVDAIFASSTARQGVSDDPIAHNAHHDASTHPGRVEIWPLMAPAKIDAEPAVWPIPVGYEEEQDAQAELAKQIAAKIKYWLDHPIILPGKTRPIAAGDIMILLRRRGRFADVMVRALKAQKVPVTGVDRMRLIHQLPVMDLLAMINFVLLPQDDLNLAALLRSPLLDMSEDDLMNLAIGRAGSLWDALQSSHHAKARDYLAARMAQADFTTPFAFLSSLLTLPCPADSISGRRAMTARLGEEALDPIDELLNEAQNFGQHHAPSLQNFLHWLAQADKEIKRELDHGKNQATGPVRLMTVHAAKGLEAPIVFLPDTVSIPRINDIPKLQWDENNTPLFLARQPAFGAARRLWQRARDKQMEEYRRLFYVALTRAESQLYICGWLDARMKDAAEESWYALARNALKPLHQPHRIEDTENPAPEIVYADPVLPPAIAPSAAKNIKPPPPLPAWARQNIAPVRFEISANQDSLTAPPDAAFARGRIIHRLLQSLPDLDPAQREAATKRFLSQPRHHLTDTQQYEIAREVGLLLNDQNFALLFSTRSLAEAPLTGTLKGAPVFRQVDRLCLVDDEVWIVDYKTNRPPPALESDVPTVYRRQMDEYRLLLREIYPDKKVRCFLLWTYAPRLMEISAVSPIILNKADCYAKPPMN